MYFAGQQRNYHRYGGRGIKIDSSWMNFANFVSDMFPSWKEGLTLDRIDNNGPYSKENCRWATKSEQMNNTRGNRMVKYQGKMISAKKLQELAPFPISPGTVLTRLDAGWSPEKILSTPVDEKLSRSKKPAGPSNDFEYSMSAHYFHPEDATFSPPTN